MNKENIIDYVAQTPYNSNRKVLGDMLDTLIEENKGGTASSAKWNDVTFIDYDGTILHSYSLAEAQTLTELPALPTHDGLICQGWNWTLEDIKALNRPVTVGAMYITDDGATRLHIRIATVGRMTVPLYIGQTIANGVVIDWGDGSTTETLDGTGLINTSHTYAEPGDYVIGLMPEDGCTLSLGYNMSTVCVMGLAANNNNHVYCNMLKNIFIGINVESINYTFRNCQSLASITIPNSVKSINSYAFDSCYSLVSITIPNSVKSIGSCAFHSCHSLASITIPNSIKSIYNNAFDSCHSLASITIPNSVTHINENVFYSCHSLASITIPNSIKSIYSSIFASCYGMRYYDFSAYTSIPTLSNTDAFNNIPSDCQMLIPSALFDEWKAATNWTTYAQYMIAV